MNPVLLKLEVPDFLVKTIDINKNKLGEYIRQTLIKRDNRIFTKVGNVNY